MHLYLGLRKPPGEHIVHFPVIAIEMLQRECPEIEACDWVIVTSQTTVEALDLTMLHGKVLFAVGEKTAKALRQGGLSVDFIPKEETQEGIIDILKTLSFKNKKIFCGGSSLSRPILKNFLKDEEFYDPILYHTKIAFGKKPPLANFQEVIFTSPSTVAGFCEAYAGEIIPEKLKLTPIGKVTERSLLMHNVHPGNVISKKGTL